MEGDSRLKLSHITASENGIYSCRAENIAGARDSVENFLLNIKGRNCVTIFITLLHYRFFSGVSGILYHLSLENLVLFHFLCV